MALGKQLFTRFALPFELISLVLLVAMIGTVLLEQEGPEMTRWACNITWWSACCLFCLGLLGVIVRRNVLVIYMSLELMLNAANLALAAFSRFNNNLDGQIIVVFHHHGRRVGGRGGLGPDRRALPPPPNHPRGGFGHAAIMNHERTAPWLILFLPLLAAAVITLFLQRPARSAPPFPLAPF